MYRKKSSSTLHLLIKHLKCILKTIMLFSYFFIKKKKNHWGLPWWFSGKESAWRCWRHEFNSWSRKIPTYCRATKLVCHNYWACALEPGSRKYWVHVLQLLMLGRPWARAPWQEKPLCWKVGASQLVSKPPLFATREKPEQHQRPSTGKSK